MKDKWLYWLGKVPAVFRNLFFLTGLSFGLWMIFFDENNILLQYTRYTELSALKQKRNYYRLETAHVQQQYEELTTSPALQEKYAREHYLMKRPGEDVFVFVKK
jgi:cell division protein DivIC